MGCLHNLSASQLLHLKKGATPTSRGNPEDELDDAAEYLACTGPQSMRVNMRMFPPPSRQLVKLTKTLAWSHTDLVVPQAQSPAEN